MAPRKRSIQEVDNGASHATTEPTVLHRIRNMWQFANLCQWLLMFGDAVKITNFDVDDFEAECLRPHSLALQEIGLSLLKYLSSHRALTHELFDEYTRRQYVSKVPTKPNPFGEEEDPTKFADFDVFQKIRVLHQMTQFVMMNPEKLREKMAESKDSDGDLTGWRIEPLGWDSDDRTYFLLDDNRLYRLTDAPPPAPKPKKNTKKARASLRASKRRRVSTAPDDSDDHAMEDVEDIAAEVPADEHIGLGGGKWECVAVTLDEVRGFVASVTKSKDPNEKYLRKQIEQHLLPLLESQEERKQKREREREKELLNLEKMAHAKRSSRIAHRAEHQRQEEVAREEEKQRLAEEAQARKAEQERRRMEKERDNRLMSRENRLKEREARRIQHEEELAQLSEDSKNVGSSSGRMSERRLQAEMESRKRALQELHEEEEDWVFDCICGLHGQVDDGEHCVACERCSVWQHSKCLNIGQQEAEREDFHFICKSCGQRQAEIEEQASRPKPPVIKIKVKGSGTPSKTAPTQDSPIAGPQMSIDVSAKPHNLENAVSDTPATNGKAQANVVTPNGLQHPLSVLQPPVEAMMNGIPVKIDGSAQRLSFSDATGTNSPSLGPARHPFSSPHPDLSPPNQSPNKSRAYGTIRDQPSPSRHEAGVKPGVGNTHSSQTSGLPRKISTTPILPPVIPGSARSLMNIAAAGNASPTKVQAHSTTKNVSPTIKASEVTTPRHGHVSNPVSQQNGSTLFSATSPKISPWHGAQASSPLPPVQGGVSPVKHSPPASRQGSFTGHPSSSPTPAVLPPVAALSPSPRQQDLTPPVKSSPRGVGESRRMS